MKVKFINKERTIMLPERVYDGFKLGNSENQSSGLTPDKEYTVYAITTIRKYSWYLICEDHFDGVYITYPMYVFHRYFKITDGRISRFWTVADNTDFYDNNERIVQFGFKEWVSEDYFYSELVEGMEREVKIFLDYKKKMDMEFLD